MVYLKKISGLGNVLYPSLLWNLPNHKKTIYLTFDDGPIPEITDWVLACLKQYQAKATFFCVGENISKHPDIFNNIISEGHTIGNHTFNHLNGWKTNTPDYLENVRKTEDVISKNIENPNNSAFKKKLFRPPYGKIKPSQIKKLQQLDYQIVMWEVISGDFDPELSWEICYNTVIKNTTEGGIIVFHDSKKAFDKLKLLVPKILKYYHEKGFEFKAL
ncbi:polysaccharide deacetylase family protein [Gillisia sp. M10.2A]|uniref:Polysaccharide deacetylase family protein n=1 Tax=Gillisia lutea TaxID=2909668 RepID=A0ABS9EDG6_9FLAO|nr:polysaccharide deacetylase family protein [Gillisia lutea]MCF4100209.1 polysaccharide deacetylase family protein [Gillisia lutea]